MKFLINCRNDKCKYYHEEGCFFSKGTISLNESGKCESFKLGKNPDYEIKVNIKGFKKIFENYGLWLNTNTMDYGYINRTWRLGNIKTISENYVTYKKRNEKKITTTHLDTFLKKEGTKC